MQVWLKVSGWSHQPVIEWFNCLLDHKGFDWLCSVRSVWQIHNNYSFLSRFAEQRRKWQALHPAGRQNHIQFWNSLRLLSKLIVQISIMCFYILKKCIKCTVPFIYIPLVMKYKSFTIKWQGESESRLAVERDKLQIFIENLTCIWSIIVV